MAGITFQREPIDGGDNAVWGSKELKQNRLSIGNKTAVCYDDSGTLKLTKGRVGIYNDSRYGVSVISSIQTISLSGLTASRWAQIELDTSNNLTITSIAAGSDATTLPSEFTSAFDYEKGGYYINSTKRCLALAWIDSGGSLNGIVNTLSDIEGYSGTSESASFQNIAGVSLATPIGEVAAVATDSVPDGFLQCDGSAVSRTTYASLFSVIGITHGEGDGSTTFNLPDYRGSFLRGFDDGAGNDPDSASRTAQATGGNTGDNVGSEQTDAMQKITGDIDVGSSDGGGSIFSAASGAVGFTANSGASISEIDRLGSTSPRDNLSFDNSNSTSPNTAKTSDNETRPLNVSVMFIIRY
jgi:microcystin-dependent protein